MPNPISPDFRTSRRCLVYLRIKPPVEKGAGHIPFISCERMGLLYLNRPPSLKRSPVNHRTSAERWHHDIPRLDCTGGCRGRQNKHFLHTRESTIINPDRTGCDLTFQGGSEDGGSDDDGDEDGLLSHFPEVSLHLSSLKNRPPQKTVCEVPVDFREEIVGVVSIVTGETFSRRNKQTQRYLRFCFVLKPLRFFKSRENVLVPGECCVPECFVRGCVHKQTAAERERDRERDVVCRCVFCESRFCSGKFPRTHRVKKSRAIMQELALFPKHGRKSRDSESRGNGRTDCLSFHSNSTNDACTGNLSLDNFIAVIWRWVRYLSFGSFYFFLKINRREFSASIWMFTEKQKALWRKSVAGTRARKRSVCEDHGSEVGIPRHFLPVQYQLQSHPCSCWWGDVCVCGLSLRFFSPARTRMMLPVLLCYLRRPPRMVCCRLRVGRWVLCVVCGPHFDPRSSHPTPFLIVLLLPYISRW